MPKNEGMTNKEGNLTLTFNEECPGDSDELNGNYQLKEVELSKADSAMGENNDIC